MKRSTVYMVANIIWIIVFILIHHFRQEEPSIYAMFGFVTGTIIGGVTTILQAIEER